MQSCDVLRRWKRRKKKKRKKEGKKCNRFAIRKAYANIATSGEFRSVTRTAFVAFVSSTFRPASTEFASQIRVPEQRRTLETLRRIARPRRLPRPHLPLLLLSISPPISRTLGTPCRLISRKIYNGVAYTRCFLHGPPLPFPSATWRDNRCSISFHFVYIYMYIYKRGGGEKRHTAD